MPQLFNYGSCCIDHVYRVPHFVAPGETLSASTYEIFPGGKGLNQSIAAAKAGARVSHIGAIGEDGQHLKTLLASQSIETSHLVMEPSASGHAIIQINDAGENAIVIFGGTNLGEHQTLLEQGLEQSSSEDWLLIQNETSCNQQAIELAKSHGMQVAFNMAPMNARALSLPLSEIDLFIVNETEGSVLTGESDAERILDAIASTYPNAQVTLTLGDQGAWYQSRSARSFAPAARATVLDTTGAGDTFTGFFLAGLLETDAPVDALHRACLAAAISVERAGAATSIPSLQEVLQRAAAGAE